MSGRPDKARELIAQAVRVAEDLGDQLMLGFNRGFVAGPAEELAGDLPAAEAELREAHDLLERIGGHGYRSSVAGLLASVLYRQGRYQEAERFVTVCQELTARDDVLAGAQWRAEQAKLLAQRGETKEAERLAQDAVQIMEATDMPDLQAYTYMSLAEVLRLAGQMEDAAAAVQEAIRRYGAKGNVAAIKQARRVLAQLDPS
jgi:tetratricopeptide (TPR) repeat protein